MSDFERLLRQTEEQRLAAASTLEIQRHADELLRTTYSGGLRPLTPREMQYADPDKRLGSVAFEHTKSKNLVFLAPDPVKGEIRANVLSGNGPDRVLGAGFTITETGNIKTISGLKVNDLSDESLIRDIQTHASKSLRLSSQGMTISAKVGSRWAEMESGKKEAAKVISQIAAEQPGLPATKAVEIGNALTGATPEAAPSHLQPLLNSTQGEREMESLLKKEAKLATKFGGAVVGLVIGTGSALAAESPREAVENFAETAIPGGSSVVALAHSRPAEAALRGIEEIPIVGGVVTEMVRDPLRSAGFSVDPSLTSQVLQVKPIELNASQKGFFDTYDRLPDKPQPGMPPEVESLVVAKGMVQDAEGKMEAAKSMSPTGGPGKPDKGASMASAQKSLDFAQGHYQEQYDSLQKSGQLKDVIEPWLETNAPKGMAPTSAPTTPEVGVGPKAPGEQDKPAYAQPPPKAMAPA